jgi:hypothetical protein
VLERLRENSKVKIQKAKVKTGKKRKLLPSVASPVFEFLLLNFEF